MKLLWIALINIMALYGPVELTRVILDWEGFAGKLIFEISFMWLFYVIAMVIASIMIVRRPGSQN